MNYLGTLGRYPVWKHTAVKYFPIGEEMFASMLEDLKKAEHYIYLEYFIIEQGIMWNSDPGDPGTESKRRRGSASDL